MGTVAELRPHAKQEFTSSLGMAVFLGSWAMMFCALFFAYGFMRARAVQWPPPGMPPLPVVLPGFNTLVLLASSFTFARGLKLLKAGDTRGLTWMVALTFGLGAVFLALQLRVWTALSAQGLHASNGIYGSVFYTLTVFHALHVGVGLLILAHVFIQSLRGKYSAHSYINVRLCTMFWHFVDVVWILMFLSLYVV